MIIVEWEPVSFRSSRMSKTAMCFLLLSHMSVMSLVWWLRLRQIVPYDAERRDQK
jgi:hypothetical protein